MEKQPRIRSDIETILLEVSNISSFLKSEPTHFLIAQKKKAIVKKMVAVLQSPELQMNTQLKSELTKEFEEFRSTLLANKNIRRVLFDMQKGFTALLFCLGGGETEDDNFRRVPGPPVVLDRTAMEGSPERSNIEISCRYQVKRDIPEMLSMDSWGSLQPWKESELLKNIGHRNVISIVADGKSMRKEETIRDYARWRALLRGDAQDNGEVDRQAAFQFLIKTPVVAFGIYRIITETSNKLLKTCVHPAFRDRGIEEQLFTHLVGRAAFSGKWSEFMRVDEHDDAQISPLATVGFQARKQKNGKYYEQDGSLLFGFDTRSPTKIGIKTLKRVKVSEMEGAQYERFDPVGKS